MVLLSQLNWEGDKVRMMFASSVRIFHFIFLFPLHEMDEKVGK